MPDITTEAPLATPMDKFRDPGGGSSSATGSFGLTSQQWRSGIAAWLGWLFDGLDMHLYTMVSFFFVASLLPAGTSDSEVKIKSAWIQAAFLVGWALGGGFFGRIGDKLGRAKALAFTVLTYALFTGLSAAATSWWHLLIYRFLAALGIGGEWAVGSSLLSETWPAKWRPWIAAVLQTGVNLGVLVAWGVAVTLAPYDPRWVFLAGILPALIVFWIRKAVPEPEEWHTAMRTSTVQPPMSDLFRGSVRRITVLTIIVCACSLTSWWSFMFWVPQLMPQLPDVAAWESTDKKRLATFALMIPVMVSIGGNFFAAWLSRRIGFRRAIAVLCFGFFVSFLLAFGKPHSWRWLLYFYLPLVGWFSGTFGLFTMYLPPLFPTLLRTTGAGFSYNIGRIVSAAGVVIFGVVAVAQSGANKGDLRQPLLYGAFLFLPAIFAAMMLPDLEDPTAIAEPMSPEPIALEKTATAKE